MFDLGVLQQALDTLGCVIAGPSEGQILCQLTNGAGQPVFDAAAFLAITLGLMEGLDDPEVNTACYSVIQSMVQQFPQHCATVLDKIYATVTASLQDKGIENLLDEVELEGEDGGGELATFLPRTPFTEEKDFMDALKVRACFSRERNACPEGSRFEACFVFKAHTCALTHA